MVLANRKECHFHLTRKYFWIISKNVTMHRELRIFQVFIYLFINMNIHFEVIGLSLTSITIKSYVDSLFDKLILDKQVLSIFHIRIFFDNRYYVAKGVNKRVSTVHIILGNRKITY